MEDFSLAIMYAIFAPIIVGSMHSAVALYTFHNTMFMDGSLKSRLVYSILYLHASCISFCSKRI